MGFVAELLLGRAFVSVMMVNLSVTLHQDCLCFA